MQRCEFRDWKMEATARVAACKAAKENFEGSLKQLLCARRRVEAPIPIARASLFESVSTALN